jgi:MFS family permease
MNDGNPTHVRYGVLGFAGSLSLITYLDRVCIMRAREDIQSDLGLDDSQMGLVFSAFLLGYALFEVPVGWMGDVWGVRRVLTRIVICWSLFTALTGCIWPFSFDTSWHITLGSRTVPLVIDSLLVLLVARFLFGVGEAGAYPNITRMLAAWFPFRERAFAQGVIWTAARMGGAIAPFTLGRLSVHFGWRLAFVVLASVGIVWCLGFFAWFRESPREKTTCNDAERELIESDTPFVDSTNGRLRLPWRKLALSVSTWALCLAYCGINFGWYFYPTWQPEYLKSVHGIQYADSEIMTGLPFFCGALGCLAGGRLSDWIVVRTGSRRWGRSGLACLGFAFAGLCVLSTGFVTQAWQAVTLLCLAFVANDLAIPGLWAACTDIGGRFAGTMGGIMNMAGGVGAIISPMLIPRILHALPETFEAAMRWRLIFAGLAVSWLLAALASLFVNADRPVVDTPVA